MARLARMIIPGVPHHVTQRGNSRGNSGTGAIFPGYFPVLPPKETGSGFPGRNMTRTTGPCLTRRVVRQPNRCRTEG